jgi:hypothetical protein
MKFSAIFVSLLILCTACGEDKESGRPTPVSQSWECRRFLGCLAAHVPGELPAEQREYGDTSSCWESSSAATICSEECTDARLALLEQHADFDQCVDCHDDTDCEGHPIGAYCDEQNRCMFCTEGYHCADPDLACVSGACVECQEDGECSAYEGACLERESGNVCRQCREDLECEDLGYGPGAVCDSEGWCLEA